MTACKRFYDLNLLSKAEQPIDQLRRFTVPGQIRNRIWPDFSDVTPQLIDRFTKEGEKYIEEIKEKRSVYGYLYFVAEHNGEWYNAADFDYQQFPLMRDKECVLKRIRRIAHTVNSKRSEFDATCLYLLYFYALLVNPALNWVTVDYLAHGNRYHQYGTRLRGKMKTVVKKVWR